MAVFENPPEPYLSKKGKESKITFAKLLAGNDKKIRDKGLKKLTSWLTLRSAGNFVFTEEDLKTIWAGLYYSMFMSDLPLVQEQLAESISFLIHCFGKNTDAALLFIKCFVLTVSDGWLGLDQYRIDKFCMLLRRFLRQSLLWLANNDWEPSLVKKLMEVYDEHVLGEKTSLGFKLHFIDIFPEELAKASKGELKRSVLLAILKPFAQRAVLTGDGRVRTQCEAFFRHLIKQTHVAADYENKLEIWKKAGCPVGDLRQMVPDESYENAEEEADSDNDEEIEGPMDPRAGGVNVFLPRIDVQTPAGHIAALMKRMSQLPQGSVKGKRLMLAFRRKFKTLDKGKYPYKVEKMYDYGKTHIKKMVNSSLKKEVASELKRTKKRKELRKLRKKNLSVVENVSSSVVTPVKKKRRKTSESKIAVKSKPMSANKKRMVRSAFIVTPTSDAGTAGAPVGFRKRKNSDDHELELPSGWIVEICDDEVHTAKRKAVESPNISGENAAVAETVISAPVAEKPPNNDADETISSLQISEPLEAEGSPSPATPSPKKSIKEIAKKHSPSQETNKENDASLQKETEIIIENKTTPPKVPAFFAHAVAKANKGKIMRTPTQISSPSVLSKELMDAVSASKSGGNRRISFNLAKNMAQEKVEYFEQLERSPQIPFDGKKFPRTSALKQGLPPSPINPFYAMKLGLYKKS